MKTIGYVWFGGSIGIVLCLHEFENELKAYIKTISGSDEKSDIEDVKDWGNSFPILEAYTLIRKNGTFEIDFLEVEKLVGYEEFKQLMNNKIN